MTEAPIDALSLAAIDGRRADALYVATGGGIDGGFEESKEQIARLRSAHRSSPSVTPETTFQFGLRACFPAPTQRYSATAHNEGGEERNHAQSREDGEHRTFAAVSPVAHSDPEEAEQERPPEPHRPGGLMPGSGTKLSLAASVALCVQAGSVSRLPLPP